ncbi:MAG: methyltransferase domain-containing protein [Nitrososphaera sp.]|jgi:trans-aconitate 2-methyltransferase
MGDWNAAGYDRVSDVQLAWGKNVLARRALKGDEIVLDAGCGPGNLTRLIAEQVPHGRIYAVDKDPDMVRHAQEKLVDCKNVQVIRADIAKVELPEKVDMVFSNAVLHWVMDHGKVFANFYHLLKGDGELVAQCGGQGNLAQTIAALDGIAATEKFAQYFVGWHKPWNFAGQQDTKALLYKAGFAKEACAYLSTEPASFAGRSQFSSFVKTVVMWPYLSRLPPGLQERFLETYLDGCKEWTLDYVRLNILARKNSNN